MHTEEEAKKLWCPHVQVSVSTGIDGTEQDDNRQSTDMDFNRSPVCIASKCMAWRWLRETPIRGLTASAESRTGIMIKSNDPKGPKLGYCGLAGKP